MKYDLTGAMKMTDTDKDNELKERLWNKVMERMHPAGTTKDVKRIVDIILGDDEIDEDGGEWIH